VRAVESLSRLETEIEGAQEMSTSADADMAAMARDEVERLAGEIAELRLAVQELLMPPDPHDDRDVIIEIRAGTGGDEAGLFAGELLRMYTRFSERRGLKVEPIEVHAGSVGGIREAIVAIRGTGAYGWMRRESGVHRV